VAYVANVGDSRAIGAKLKSGGYYEVIPLSNDHNTENANEVKAVVERSGEAQAVRIAPNEKNGPKRVDGVLMVTRAIGDYSLKPCYITNEGEVKSMTITEGDFIVLASDGITDHLSSEEIVNEVSRSGHEDNAAQVKNSNTRGLRV